MNAKLGSVPLVEIAEVDRQRGNVIHIDAEGVRSHRRPRWTPPWERYRERLKYCHTDIVRVAQAREVGRGILCVRSARAVIVSEAKSLRDRVVDLPGYFGRVKLLEDVRISS
jgi:hypothetical protein